MTAKWYHNVSSFYTIVSHTKMISQLNHATCRKSAQSDYIICLLRTSPQCATSRDYIMCLLRHHSVQLPRDNIICLVRQHSVQRVESLSKVTIQYVFYVRHHSEVCNFPKLRPK